VAVKMALVEEPGRLRDLGDRHPALEHPAGGPDPMGKLETMRRDAECRAEEPG
jgi:hypothetical protein